MGISEFSHVSLKQGNKYKLISKYLLPCFKPASLAMRVQNESKSKKHRKSDSIIGVSQLALRLSPVFSMLSIMYFCPERRL